MAQTEEVQSVHVDKELFNHERIVDAGEDTVLDSSDEVLVFNNAIIVGKFVGLEVVEDFGHTDEL